VPQRSSFEQHITRICRDADDALRIAAASGRAFEGIVLHAGKQVSYHADDQEVFFHPTPHFARFAPVAGPDHLILYRPGRAVRLVRVVPRDYWYEAPAAPSHPYAEVLEVIEVATREEARNVLGDVKGCAYVGNDPDTAQALGLGDAVEPASLMAPLDWSRGLKTPYEVECIREAARVAARGHRAVREGVARRLTERDLHAAYLQATGLLDAECPYGNIIAWDDRSATLHYQSKRTSPP
jgi:Xaa-Pro dipeptidase